MPGLRGQRLLTTGFADSGILIDWCPSCNGIWLDYHELQEIVAHLREELEPLTPEELKAKVGEDLKDILHPPGRGLADLHDAGAALGALVHATIFQHPRLFHLLVAFPALWRVS